MLIDRELNMEEIPKAEHNDLTKELQMPASKQTENLHSPCSNTTFLELDSSPGLCMMYSLGGSLEQGFVYLNCSLRF
jgi:hypothetical protein